MTQRCDKHRDGCEHLLRGSLSFSLLAEIRKVLHEIEGV